MAEAKAVTQTPLLDGEEAHAELPTQAELDAEWAITRMKVMGVQVFERKTHPCCCFPFHFTTQAYHFVDLLLSFGFLLPPLLLCTLWTKAFWIAMGTILLHNATHFFTDWRDSGTLRSFSTYTIPLKAHTLLGDVTFGIGTFWVAFGTTEADGLTYAASVFYKTVAVAYVFNGPLILGRLVE